MFTHLSSFCVVWEALLWEENERHRSWAVIKYFSSNSIWFLGSHHGPRQSSPGMTPDCSVGIAEGFPGLPCCSGVSKKLINS